MFNRIDPRGALGLLIVVLATVALLLPPLIHWRDLGDFAAHAAYIDRMLAREPGILNEVPNFMYHLLVIALNRLLPGAPLATVKVEVALGLYVLLAATLHVCCRRILDPYTWRSELVAVVVTLALLVIAPVFFLTPQTTYFGYFAPYVYHNPTQIPLRPFSLLLFLAAVAVFTPLWPRPARSATLATRPHPQRQRLLRAGQVVAVAGLSVASLLSKPAFVMILLPALAVVTLVQRVRRRPIDWLLLVAGIGVPAVGLLGYQALTYSAGGLALEPLRTFYEWSLHYDPEAQALLPLKLVLSVLFPLVVYALYWPQSRHSLLLNLAWLCFAAGAAYAYLFVDTGEPAAGNLIWNAQIGAFILHLATALYWVQYLPRRREELRPGWRFFVGGAALALHVSAGGVWYALHLRATWPEIIYTAW
ncbi:MAG: hypothetical protein MUE40_16655 [Anaerolineae bacterium]|jgi:hypothetical protein|nr:hypothetical protein [Anaerolineae bacterium]